ncbi:MAG: hypothetical protein RLZZ203_1976, partial [Cyanobacteriota bacterium]
GKDNDKGGDAKKDLLTKIPIKSVDIIRDKPDSIRCTKNISKC